MATEEMLDNYLRTRDAELRDKIKPMLAVSDIWDREGLTVRLLGNPIPECGILIVPSNER